MFRARKPSVQRASPGKYAGEVPVIKPEPLAEVDDIKPEVPLINDVKPTAPSAIVSDFELTKTTALRPPLPALPLPSKEEPAHMDLIPAPRQDMIDTDTDVRYWEKKHVYKPWHADDDDDEDLTREVRKDRKIAPENDPLFAQIFTMFPEEQDAK